MEWEVKGISKIIDFLCRTLLLLTRVPFCGDVFAGCLLYLRHVPVQPDGHGCAAVAKAFLYSVMPLLSRPGAVDKAGPTLAARAPLRDIDPVAGPDAEHV